MIVLVSGVLSRARCSGVGWPRARWCRGVVGCCHVLMCVLCGCCGYCCCCSKVVKEPCLTLECVGSVSCGIC